MENSFQSAEIPKKRTSLFAYLLDERFLQILAQLVFAGIILFIAYGLYQNMAKALAKQGMVLGYDFLRVTSGFDISIKLIEHTRESSNWQAIGVGIINTIIASIISIILSTILGVLVGIMRISRNYLVNRVAWLYIEIFRNIPLLLVIIASYSVYIYNLPNVNNSIVILGTSFLSNRGLYIPKPVPTEIASTYLLMLLGGLFVAIFLAWFIKKRYRLDSFLAFVIGLGIFTLLGVVFWFLLPQAPFGLDIPAKKGLNYQGGISLPPELIAIILGLVLGSSPFTADTVRSGLQSVSKGQIEASRALGLNSYHTMRLVVFPQAMRVIVPPMTSNYLSLIKNSSLASAVAYPEIVHISSTITSQTGRAVEVMSIVMLIYASLSLITSLFMNWFNNRVKIPER